MCMRLVYSSVCDGTWRIRRKILKRGWSNKDKGVALPSAFIFELELQVSGIGAAKKQVGRFLFTVTRSKYMGP